MVYLSHIMLVVLCYICRILALNNLKHYNYFLRRCFNNNSELINIKLGCIMTLLCTVLSLSPHNSCFWNWSGIVVKVGFGVLAYELSLIYRRRSFVYRFIDLWSVYVYFCIHFTYCDFSCRDDFQMRH